jgi:predicted dehydrogenase
MTRPWKIGLIGAGYIAEAHIKALRTVPGVEIAAICDRVRARAEEAAARFGIRAAFESQDAMLATALDVVHVLVPAQAHAATTRAALESGRHVFVEKPMALSSADCSALAALADQKGVKLAVNHNFLFLPCVEALRRQARDGTIGHIDRLSVNWLYPLPLIQAGPFDHWMLRAPENLFLEIGPHLVSLMLYLVGRPDRLVVDVGRPLDLPGGARVFRHWRVLGERHATAVDLSISFVQGAVDRSVTVRGHAAWGRADLERDLYVRDEPTGYALLFDNLYAPLRVARQSTWNAVASFSRGVAGTLKKSSAANPFTHSIACSVQRFYQTLEGSDDARLTPRFGVDVIGECERIVAAAPIERPALRGNERNAVAPPTPASPKALVIGGTGFIGRHLVRALIARGVGVRIVTRGSAGARMLFENLPVDIATGDLVDPAFLDAALDGIEVVYHLAKANGKNWQDYYREDVLVTKSIAERAQARGVRRFVYTGTIDSYFSGRAGDLITGDTPLDPKIESRNHYGRSKATCEALLMQMYRASGFPVVVLRPGIVIGMGCPPAHWGVGKFVADTRVQLWGDGQHPLPFVLVEDVADALVRAYDTPGIEGKAFLVTDAPLLSGREYVEAVSKAWGTRLRAEAVPIWRFYLADLLKETIKHLIRHPNRRRPTYRDWASRSHVARYDSSTTRDVLGWRPAGSRGALLERGVMAAAREHQK